MAGQPGTIKQFVRRKISPCLTNFYAGLGFARRTKLASLIKNNFSSSPKTAIAALVRNGIIKSRFTDKITSLDQIQEFHLCGSVTRKRLAASSIASLVSAENADQVFAQGFTEKFADICSSLRTTTLARMGTDARFSTFPFVFGLAAMAGIAALMATTGVPLGFSGIGLISSRLARHFPAGHAFGKTLRFVGKTAALGAIVDGAVLSGAVFSGNLNVVNLFDAIGTPGTVGLFAGGAGLLKHFVTRHQQKMMRSFGGHIDPGDLLAMRAMMRRASLSVAAEAHYIAARLILLVAASAYIFGNLTTGGMLTFSLPVAATIVTAGLRSFTSFENRVFDLFGVENEKKKDLCKIHLPLIGTGTGFLASAIPILWGDWVTVIAYAAFWGSAGNFFISELHGSFHSINTSLGLMANLQASTHDHIGDDFAEDCARHTSTLVINPNTGIEEHTFGILFSVLLARRPGLRFICMFDRILMEKNKEGKSPSHEAHVKNENYLAWVRTLQAEMYKKITDGITPQQSPAEGYAQLAKNLEALADFVKTEIPRQITTKVAENPSWFDKKTKVAEYLRGAFAEVEKYAHDLRVRADKMNAKGAAFKGNSSQQAKDEFEKDYAYHAGCYDPELVTIDSVARKEMDGDELKVRKVENVATIGIFRGLAVYKLWRDEAQNSAHPAVAWVCGTWTRIDNPHFRRDADAGTLAASRYLWVESDQVLHEIQKLRKEHLSTHDTVLRVDNTPSGTGFIPGNTAVTIKVDGKDQTFAAQKYYFMTGENQDQMPPVADNYLVMRNGTQVSKQKYQESGLDGWKVCGWEQKKDNPAGSSCFVVPRFDYTLMQDKNDIELTSYLLLPAIIARDCDRNPHAVLRFREPYGKDMHFASPRPDLTWYPNRDEVEVIDGNLSLSYQGREIPLMLDRAAAHVGKVFAADDKNTVGNNPAWQNLSGAKVRMENGAVKEFVLIYGNQRVQMPESCFPRYIDALQLPSNDWVSLTTDIMMNPVRDGDTSWLKFTYNLADREPVYAFYRCPDGKRPFMFQKTLLDPTTGKPRIVRFFSIEEKDGQIHITNNAIPRGLPIALPLAWVDQRGLNLAEGDRVVAVRTAGDAFIDATHQFTPEPNGTNHKGQTLMRIEGSGQVVALELPSENLLPHHLRLADCIRDAIEVRHKEGENKMQVVSRRKDLKGLPDDQSAYVYNVELAAFQRLRQAIPELRWILQNERGIQIDKNGLTITYQVPGENQPKIFTMAAAEFKDNFGKDLLGNAKANMESPEDIYQGTDARLRPHLDFYNGRLRLIVDKIQTEEIDCPQALRSQSFTGHLSGANGAAKVVDQTGKFKCWVPLTLDEPLAKALEDGAVLDADFSQIHFGLYKAAIGPQIRLGNAGEMSGLYPRDPYFYGLEVFADAETRERRGEYFGINRAKGIRADTPIQSGRTHTMDFRMLYNVLFADFLETNAMYGRKASNFGSHIGGPGVSEDTQQEKVSWMLGIYMWVVKDYIDIMTAEKDWGSYNNQNTNRYNLSETLFYVAARLAARDAFRKLTPFSRRPATMTMAQISEIAAGRTWYKVPLAKTMELAAIPAFLGTLGHVLFFPVDLAYFMGSWLFRTVFSSLNYWTHLRSLGFGFRTGFWTNCGIELSYFAGYFKKAFNQFLTRAQFGTFISTVSGRGAALPPENRRAIRIFAAANAISMGLGIAALAFGGISALSFPLGLAIAANLFFGAYSFGLLANSLYQMHKAARGDAKQKSSADFEREFSRETNCLNTIKQRLEASTGSASDISSDISYDELFSLRQEMFDILKTIGAVKGKKIAFGLDNPYRDVANDLMDLYAGIEMAVTVRALRGLRDYMKGDSANPACLAEHHAALEKLLKGKNATQEFAVQSAALTAYRTMKMAAFNHPQQAQQTANQGAGGQTNDAAA